MEYFTIREATIDDAIELRGYANQLFAEGLPGVYERPTPTLEQEREFILAHSRSERSMLLAAEANGRIIGVLGLMALAIPQEAHVGVLGISVARGFRGQGVGSALIDAVCALAPQRGVRRIELEVFSANPDAMRFYERHGFEPEGVRRRAVVVAGEISDVHMYAKLFADAPD